MSNLSVLAFDEAPRGHGGRGATEQIARLLDSSEIDAPASLYDEALTLAKEGRFAPATDRLRMLLTLDPIDSEAALLLGKVLAARGQWQEALQRLDAAQANGAAVPTSLRERVENALRNQIQDAEEQRLRLAARERTEIRNTRAEAKRLRSDNAVLDAQVQALYKRVRLWSSATALVSASTDVTEKAVVDAETMAATSYGYGVQTTTETVGTVDTVVETPIPAATIEIPPPAVETTTTPSVALPTTHTVVSGDTLGSIALNYYGKSSKWREIRDANPDVLGGSIKLSLGMNLNIPTIAD